MSEETPRVLMPAGGSGDDHGHHAAKSTRRPSVGHSDHGPALSHPHTRRMSRMLDPNMLPGAAGGRRGSLWRRSSYALSFKTDRTDPPLVRLQNTYRTEPNPREKFIPAEVRKVAESALKSYLEGEVYEARKCAHLTQSLTDVIKNRVKEMNLPRYKIVCNVVIGQKQRQAIRYASRCLWNHCLDTCAFASYENSTLFAMATVYGVYFE